MRADTRNRSATSAMVSSNGSAIEQISDCFSGSAGFVRGLLMVLDVVYEVAPLAQGAQVFRPTVFRDVIEMGDGEHDPRYLDAVA